MNPPNIVILAVDTMRAANLSCYGYHRQTSPRIDRLAAEGALGENFFCAGLPTHPSFSTLITGQHPMTHGIVTHAGENELDVNAPILARSFLQSGYVTCAVDNLLQHRLWFGRGYEFYIDPSQRKHLSLDVSCDELNARVLPWIRQNKDDPFFLFVHYWDPHWPLHPPERYRHLFYEGDPFDPSNHSLEPYWETSMGSLSRDTWLRFDDRVVTDAEYITAMYDQEIRHVDEGIGQVIDTIEEAGLADDTLILVIGDHGENITEHNIYVEHRSLYDTVLHVPFVMRWPGHIPAGTRIKSMIQHHDIAPTLLEAAELEVPFEMDGESIWPLLSGASTKGGRDRVIACECSWQSKWCLRTMKYKFILARIPDRWGLPDRELYDLETDPNELNNIATDLPEVARSMEAELETWIHEQMALTGRTVDPLSEHELRFTWE